MTQFIQVIKKIWTVVKNVSQGVKSFFINFFIILIILMLTYAIFKEVNNEEILFNATDVPNTLIEKGYTGTVIARQIVDEINLIKVKSEDSLKFVPLTKHKDFSVIISSNSPELNFEVPKTGLYFSSITNFIRHYFKKDRTVINSEIIIKNGKAIIIARYENSRVVGISRLDSLNYGFHQVALGLIGIMQPLVAANFLFKGKEYVKCEKLINNHLIEFNKIELSQAYCILGLVNENLNKSQKAEKLFTQAIQEDESNSLAYCFLAGSKYDVGKKSESEKIIKKVLTLPYKSTLTYYVLGAIMYEQDNLEEAERFHKEALKINPNFIMALNDIAIIKLDQEKYLESETYLSKVLKLSPYDLEAHNTYGLIFLAKNKYEEAEEYFNTSISINKKYTDAYINLAKLKIKQNKTQEAEKIYLTILKINPKDAYTLQSLGYMNDVNNNHKKAIFYYEQSLKIDSTLFSPNYNLGVIRLNQKKYHQAEKLFQRIVTKIKPSEVNAYVYLASIKETQGKISEAETLLKSALKIDSSNVSILNTLGSLKYNMGLWEESEYFYKRSVVLDSLNANVYYNLGLTARQLGKDNEANEFFNKAIDLNPDFTKYFYNSRIPRNRR